MGKSRFINIAVILTAIVLSGCGGKKNKAPFFDGLYLTYHERLGASPKTIERNINYKFCDLKYGNFKIVVTEDSKFGDKLENSKLKLPFPKHIQKKIFVDFSGEILKDTKRYIKGAKIDIYLPEDKMKKGASAFEFWRVKGKTHWERWEVWKLKPLTSHIYRYYDVETGFLVGEEDAMSNKRKLLLVNTNAGLVH